MIYSSTLNTRFGTAIIQASTKGIRAVSFGSSGVQVKGSSHALIEQCKQELVEYFNGDRHNFSVSLDMVGTSFYQRVWQQLLKIPYGKTCSYLDIAIALGDKRAVRAVGMANGKNPIAIIVPCHRVIGAHGSLTGYAYGLEMKKQLLMLENPQTRGVQQKLF